MPLVSMGKGNKRSTSRKQAQLSFTLAATGFAAVRYISQSFLVLDSSTSHRNQKSFYLTSFIFKCQYALRSSAYPQKNSFYCIFLTIDNTLLSIPVLPPQIIALILIFWSLSPEIWRQVCPLFNIELNIFGIGMQAEQKTYQIRGSHFPFGVLSSGQESRKIFVKKRYSFRSEEEYEQLMVKVQKLKSISHKNTINLRSIEENDHSIDAVYQYVPLSLEDSFSENSCQTVKEMHRQFIELAIYLAKNFILTTFSPKRCGVVVNEGTSILKYYLPLNEITLTDNRSSLERSVQLFNVQSMHYLDSLASQCLNSTINQNCSQRTFKNRVKLFPSKHQKDRRDSQPCLNQTSIRKFSNNPTKQSQIRKLSTLSRELSQISKMHKRRGASTRVSGQSFQTLRSVHSLKSHPETSAGENSKITINSRQQSLKRCLSQNGISQTAQIGTLIARSRRALDSLQNLKEKMWSYKGFFDTLIKVKQAAD